MKAMRFHAPGDVRLEDVPEAECRADEVKIRVRNCSMCGTDLKTLRNGHHMISRVTTMGHEIAGEIVEVGSEVTGNWAPGDRVQTISNIPCGHCYECRRGWTQICANQASMGFQYDGGFARHMIVPAAMLRAGGLNRIPDGVGFAEASAAEPFSCAINAQEQLGIEEGDTVVVFGAGPIGCMHVRIARAVHGAGTVILVNHRPGRLEKAAALVRPDHTIDSSATDVVEAVSDLTGGRGADVVITATPAGQNQQQAVEMAARNGRISFFGGLPKTFPTITLDSNLVHYRQLHIHGTNGSTPEQNRQALAFFAAGTARAEDLITDRIPLDDGLRAFDVLAGGEAVKVTVEP